MRRGWILPPSHIQQHSTTMKASARFLLLFALTTVIASYCFVPAASAPLEARSPAKTWQVAETCELITRSRISSSGLLLTVLAPLRLLGLQVQCTHSGRMLGLASYAHATCLHRILPTAAAPAQNRLSSLDGSHGSKLCAKRFAV